MKKEWLMGVCEVCDERHSVRLVQANGEASEKFSCWQCVSPLEWMLFHAERPLSILNTREMAK